MNVPDPAAFTPEAVAASMGRGDGGFGRAQTSYYDLPVVRASHWKWEIASYFWVGGIMSGSAVLAFLNEHVAAKPDPALTRNARWTGVLGGAASGLLLIKDLSRPERFLNMLRILKLKSPMSVGAWGLVGFSLSGAAALAAQLKRDSMLPVDPVAFVPPVVRDGAFAVAGGLMATYTGVLVSATAIPVWYRGRHFLPAIFVASATANSCAANAALLALAPTVRRSTLEKLERIETLASALELALLLAYERIIGRDAAALFGGAVGKRLKSRTMLAGIAVPIACNVWSWRRAAHAMNGVSEPGVGLVTRLRTLASAALTLHGGYVLRDAVLQAGRRSADDPRPVLDRR